MVVSQQTDHSRQLAGTTKTSFYHEAMAAHAAGLSPIPTKEKVPTIPWGEFQQHPMTEAEIKRHFGGAVSGLGIACGEASGNLEVLDFDLGGAAAQPYAENLEGEKPGLLDRLPKEQTPSGGFHIFLRAPGPVSGNRVLAQRLVDGKPKALIETRGQGGQVQCAPTPGYAWLDGGFDSIPALTKDEYEAVIRAARACNEYVAPSEVRGPTREKSSGDGVKPGDDFNDRGDISPYLEAAGWTLCGQRGKFAQFTRPGKERGISASWIDGRVFHVFTSNASPFEQNSAYSNFAVYAMLRHEGNYSAAAKALARDGYGTPLGNKPADTEPTLDGMPLTEDGIARVFTARHQNELRYDRHAAAWYRYVGNQWVKDEKNLAFHWARMTCRDLNTGNSKVLAKANTAGAVERFARSDPSLTVTSEIWDADVYLLGTPAGVVDLRSGQIREGRREDYITKSASVAPSDTADCPVWLQFLREATQGDQALQRFMQQIAGYALTGDIREHALFFMYGPGGNGKSVFLNTITNILADYATTAAMDTFTASRSDRHPTDLAMLRGARLVCASETEEGRAWAESRIKQLTGGDTITARFMRQDFFEYRPQFKLLIVGNHQPILQNVDDAAKRRFNIIPFVHKPVKPDSLLETKLRDEYPAILRWMIGGCLDWQANGLVRPDVVTDATKAYFAEQDLFGQWIDEKCEVGPEKWEVKAMLYANWKAFAEESGDKPGSAKTFHGMMLKRGFLDAKKRLGNAFPRAFTGLSLTRAEKRDQDSPPWAA